MWKKYQAFLTPKLKCLLAGSILLSSAEIIPVLGVAFCIQRALNIALEQGNSTSLILNGVAILGFTLCITLLTLANQSLALKINQKMARNIYEKIIEKALRLNPIAQPKTGSLDQSILHDADKFHSMGAVFLIRSLPSGIVSIAISAFLFWINPILSLFLFLGLPIYFLGLQFIEKKNETAGLDQLAVPSNV